MDSHFHPSPFHPRQQELPPVLPVLPLAGALLLPWMRFPLNIFEPRYVTMILEALGLGRMIGMIQPAMDAVPDDQSLPPLYSVGCAGRISAFAETPDGRILATLSGCVRFRVVQERPQHRAYRLIEPDYSPYWEDLEPPAAIELDRMRLIHAAKDALTRLKISCDAQALESLGNFDLVNTVAMTLPMEPREKQALLEAPDATARCEILYAVLSMARFSGGSESRHQ